MHPWICHLLMSMSLSVVAVGQKSRLLFLFFFPDPMLMSLSSQSSKGKESWKFSFETFSPIVLGRCWERILCSVCDRGSLIKKKYKSDAPFSIRFSLLQWCYTHIHYIHVYDVYTYKYYHWSVPLRFFDLIVGHVLPIVTRMCGRDKVSWSL